MFIAYSFGQLSVIMCFVILQCPGIQHIIVDGWILSLISFMRIGLGFFPNKAWFGCFKRVKTLLLSENITELFRLCLSIKLRAKRIANASSENMSRI